MSDKTSAKDRIIFALDVPQITDCMDLIKELAPYVGAFKVGLELLSAEGPRCIKAIHESGGRVFYDGKFNDIPNTVAGASLAASRLNVWMFNVHASAGADAMRAAVSNKGNSLVTAVTVLTSISDAQSREIFGVSPSSKVLDLARMALNVGIDGLICSPLELSLVAETFGTRPLITVVPGIRPAWAPSDDQARLTTPRDAILAGASFIVVGRPIRKPPKEIGRPSDAAQLIAREIEDALREAEVRSSI